MTLPKITLLLLGGAFFALQILLGGVRLPWALAAFVAVAVAGLATVGLARVPRVRPHAVCLATALLLGGYLAARAWWSPVPVLARPDFFTALAALVVYLVSAITLCETRHRMAIALVLIVAAVGHVGVGLAQLQGQQNFMLLPWVARPDYGFRASGFFASPAQLSAALGMCGVLALGIACWSRVGLPVRALAFYGFVVCLTGVALTGSRSGYIATGGGLLFFLALSGVLAQRFDRPNFFGLALASAVALTALVAAALLFIVRSEIFQERLRHTHEIHGKARLLAPVARAQLQLSPAFGTGAGTFLLHARTLNHPALQYDPQHAHHEFRELLAEYGWTGGALAGAFFLAHVAGAAFGIRRVFGRRVGPFATVANSELALIAGALAALAIGFVHALREPTFHLPANALLAAFLFAILANPTVESGRQRRRAPLPWWLTFLAPALAGLLLALVLWRLPSALGAERARLALRDGDLAGALARAQHAATADPANADAWFVAGEAARLLAADTADPARATELRQQAARAFAAGLRAFPQDVRLLLRLAQVHGDLGEFAAATPLIEQALAAAPSSGLVLSAAGYHWHRQKQLARARAAYERAREFGETEFSRAGLEDLTHDEAAARANDAFADFLAAPTGR